MVLRLSSTQGAIRQPDAWRRVDPARFPGIQEEFGKAEYRPRAGEVWEAHHWERSWRKLRDLFKERGRTENPSRRMTAAVLRGNRRFGGGEKEVLVKQQGFYKVDLYPAGSAFADELEKWVEKQFPKEGSGRRIVNSAFRYHAFVDDPAEARALGGRCFDRQGKELSVELLRMVEEQTGFGPSLLTSYHPMVGHDGALVGKAHGDDSGDPSLAVMVSVGGGGAVSTAVVDVSDKYCPKAEKVAGMRTYEGASYEDIKQMRWEEARRSGLAGESHPRARVWSPDGSVSFLWTYRSLRKQVRQERHDEPFLPRTVGGRPKLPQGSALCFDATAPHLSPGVCREGEGPRYTIYLGYASGKRGGAARSGPLSWENALAGEEPGDKRSAFDEKGRYRLRSAASNARTHARAKVGEKRSL